MGPIIGGALIGAGGSLLGGLFSNWSNRREAQLNREWQEKMLDKQMAYQSKMWNATNAYNSPANKRKLYEEAGFNPYQMVNGMQMGNATASSAPSAPSGAQATQENVLQHLPQSAFTVAQLLQQKKVQDSQVQNTDSQTDLNRITAQFAAIEKIVDMKLKLSQEKSNMKQQDYYDSMTALNELEGIYFARAKGTDIQLNEYRAEQTRLQNDMLKLEIQGFPQKYSAELAEIFSRIRSNNASAIRALRSDLEQRFGKMPKSISERWQKAELEYQEYMRDYRRRNRGSDSQLQYWQSEQNIGSAGMTALGLGSSAIDFFGPVLRMWLMKSQ
uniref:DNA pilot protein n=1 Tax=Parvoviridae sp. TaxID=1940570 RepID=A0A7D3QRG2_9VIRU|nr:MAG: hypothetical protein [Parvoviridae sp.]